MTTLANKSFLLSPGSPKPTDAEKASGLATIPETSGGGGPRVPTVEVHQWKYRATVAERAKAVAEQALAVERSKLHMEKQTSEQCAARLSEVIAENNHVHEQFRMMFTSMQGMDQQIQNLLCQKQVLEDVVHILAGKSARHR